MSTSFQRRETSVNMLDACRYYPTKKALKACIGQPLRYAETSLFGEEYRANGKVMMVGPDAYNKRTWYATITMKDGVIEHVE